MASVWTMTARGDRIDWTDIKDRIDLGNVAIALLGPAPGRRLCWRCPFHEDRNPSFSVNSDKKTWRCYGCSEHGDAPALVMKLRGLTFPEAVRWLADQAGIVAPSGKPVRPRPPIASPAKAPERPPDPPSGLPLADALTLVKDSEKRLWTPEGADALAYLKGRGLTEATIRQARLGWTAGVMIPKSDGVGYWRASGVTIPWFDGDRLALVKIRQPEGRSPKYGEAFRDRPTLYPTPKAVRPGKPLVIVEGEFDAILLGQELGELAVVVTLGSASSRPEGSTYSAMILAPVWYLAHDADQAGDQAASGWPARAIRVRPPAPHNDWTELHQAGFNNLRYLWGGVIRQRRTPWDELASQRWGPAPHDPTPGIVIDRPSGRAVAIVDDPEERAAIQGEGCP
jgi:hypothetical protein